MAVCIRCAAVSLFKLFQDIYKLRGPDYWVIGDQWEVKVSGGSGNEPVVKLVDVGDLRCCKEHDRQKLKIDKRLPYFFFKKLLGSMPASLRIALNVPSGISPG